MERLARWYVQVPVLLFGVASGCVRSPLAVPVDPQVNFAAHREHQGIVIDRVAGSPMAIVVTGRSLLSGSGPAFLLQSNDATLAAFWVRDSTITVRRSTDPASALIGEVDANREGQAIRFALKPSSGAAFYTSKFERVDGQPAPASIGPAANTILDVRGTYIAEIRNAEGAAAGWLRARVSPYQAATRIYDGVLPDPVNGPLAAAAVAKLDAEIDWVENHAVDVYQGN